jgi:AbrB family looped-hinge helix DNA binding protein
MTLVRMKDKGQVTIPATVREMIDAQTGDMFDVAVLDGNIVLRPREVVTRQPSTTHKPIDVSGWIGAGRGLFKTPGEADAFIRAERQQWD